VSKGYFVQDDLNKSWAYTH